MLVYNTVRIGAMVDDLAASGHVVARHNLARASPTVDAHMIATGSCHFNRAIGGRSAPSSDGPSAAPRNGKTATPEAYSRVNFRTDAAATPSWVKSRSPRGPPTTGRRPRAGDEHPSRRLTGRSSPTSSSMTTPTHRPRRQHVLQERRPTLHTNSRSSARAKIERSSSWPPRSLRQRAIQSSRQGRVVKERGVRPPVRTCIAPSRRERRSCRRRR